MGPGEMPVMLPFSKAPAGTLVPPPGHIPPQALLVTSHSEFASVARLPRVFGRAGFEVTVLTCVQGAALRSRFTRHSVVVGGGAAGVVDYLEQHGDELVEGYDCIVACDEPLLVEFAKRPVTDRLSERMPFLPNRRDLQLFLSNIEYLTLARAAGLAVPEFEVCRDLPAAKDAVERLGYPVILKQDYSTAGCGVHLLRDESELRARFHELVGSPQVLIQRYVQGRVGGTSILMDHGRPVCWFSFYKMFNWPRAFSPSGGGEVVHDGQIDALVQGMPGLGHFHGFCAIDWIHETATGVFHLVELNPRATPVLDPAADHGCDFSRALAAMWFGDAQPARRECAGEVYAMFPEAACRAIDDRNLALLVLSLRDARWSDPGLMLCQSRELIVDHLVPRVLLSLRKVLVGFRRSEQDLRKAADPQAVRNPGF